MLTNLTELKSDQAKHTLLFIMSYLHHISKIILRTSVHKNAKTKNFSEKTI